MISIKSVVACPATFVLCATLAHAAPIPPPQPDSIVNIPASAGNPRAEAADNFCEHSFASTIFTAIDPNRKCMVAFPIVVPAGHSIKQISVIYSNSGNFPNPFISAYLDTRQFKAPYSVTTEFYWSSSSVPSGTIETTRLMSQLGNTYYDTFAVSTDTLYNVVVQLNSGMVIHGLEMTYN